MSGYRYELRVVSDYDYNSHADVGFFYFTNGVRSAFSPAGNSEKRLRDKVVLCRLRSGGKTPDGKDGYYFCGLAEVNKFSEDGRPIEFGYYTNNCSHGGWVPPTAEDTIYDERAEITSAVEVL